MDYITTLNDSIETSLKLGLYSSRQRAIDAQLKRSEIVKFQLKCANDMENFNKNRLQSTANKAYPPSDRPRGKKDIESVNYWRKIIKSGKEIPPIWVAYEDIDYILLDGAHRIVAAYIEGKKTIPAYLIDL